MGVIIIPFDYEQLPESQQKEIVPICISAVDRHGRPIARVWFEEAAIPSVRMEGWGEPRPLDQASCERMFWEWGTFS